MLASLEGWDHACFRWLNGLQGNPFIDRAFEWWTHLGTIGLGVTLPLTIIAVSEGPRALSGLRRWLLRAVAVSAAVGAVATGLKLLIGRSRPPLVLTDVKVIGSELHLNSFPSGHTLTAFIVAAVLLRWRRPIGIAWLLVAVGVGLSRVYLGAHFPSDVLAGALLGFVPTYLLTREAPRQ